MASASSPRLQDEFVPSTQDELARFLVENFAGSKRALSPAGGRTAVAFGGALSRPAVTVDMTRLDRVVDFPARDMTITVEAGIRVAQLAQVLKGEGQRLPIDVAQSSRGTLGGALATNTSGPRRFGYGTFRDYVIGITAMTAEGRVFHSGGRVVKNVAGYDLCKLLVGSLGTLAIVTQVTLKLKPLAESSVLVWTSFNSLAERDAAVAGLLTSETRPMAIEILNPPAAALVENQARTGLPSGESILIVGYEGSAREAEWQIETVRQELTGRAKAFGAVGSADADRLWAALTEFPTCNEDTIAFQANVLPSKVAFFEEQASRLGLALLSHAGDGIVIAKREAAASEQAGDLHSALRQAATECGASLMPLHGDPLRQKMPTLHSSSPGAWSLMQKLKQTFDPHDLLNPGRIFNEG